MEYTRHIHPGGLHNGILSSGIKRSQLQRRDERDARVRRMQARKADINIDTVWRTCRPRM
jgi:hypothetical protein